MADIDKPESLKINQDVLSDIQKKLTMQLNEMYRKRDENDYYETFGIPEEDRAKFTFPDVSPSEYVPQWNDWLDVTPVAYWRDTDMPKHMAYTVDTPLSVIKEREQILRDAEQNDPELYFNQQNAWNIANLYMRAIEAKNPNIKMGFNSGYRPGDVNRQHKEFAFDVQPRNLTTLKQSRDFNNSVAYQTAIKLFGNAIDQYINEKQNRFYWTHLAVKPWWMTSKYNILPENQFLFDYNKDAKTYKRSLPYVSEEDFDAAMELFKRLYDKNLAQNEE